MKEMNEMKEKVKELNNRYKHLNEEELLRVFLEEHKGKIALSSSLSIEDQVITHLVLGVDPEARIFTLDTGRLFPETYDLIARTNARYKTRLQVYFPDWQAVEAMVNEKGINLFYDSIENRKQCCHIRKVEPLRRAFRGLEVWICGLRREQSVTRTHLERIEWDADNGLIKLNPLIDWTEAQVWEFIRANNIPYNTLHEKGFPSIGCQPCTRAIEPGEDLRAGRWWWENPETRECGLHKK
ncbi:MAG: phosphoadenylyl-sulfate reductase [Bacteroidales bacterium]